VRCQLLVLDLKCIVDCFYGVADSPGSVTSCNIGMHEKFGKRQHPLDNIQ
jgi:hypothetical protein